MASLKKSKCCKVCKHAEWEYTATGRIKRNVAGRCMYEVVWPKVPFCQDPPSDHRTAIWPDTGEDCPCCEVES